MAMTREERVARRKANAEAKARMEKSRAECKAVVASGKCPRCQSPLRRNLALTGWWQCSQYGSDGFRKDSTKPACDWQGFTE